MHAPAIKDQVKRGRLAVVDVRQARLIVCRNADLAAKRSHKREELLAATGRDLARNQTVTMRQRQPLRGTANLALAAGGVIDKHKMRKHFDLTNNEPRFTFACKTAAMEVRTKRQICVAFAS